jgi:6,7-dimethyl-8-ribityllumazine synthase
MLTMKEYSGQLQGNGLRIAIVISRFNELITRSLLSSSLDGLKRHGVLEDNISVAWVPGAFDIPLIAKFMADSGGFDAVICLGAVIRGATPHFDYVAGHAASGIASASQQSGIPVIFGLLTTNTIEEAIERAGTKAGNKGFDAAVSAIEMANLIRQLEEGSEACHPSHQVSCCSRL